MIKLEVGKTYTLLNRPDGYGTMTVGRKYKVLAHPYDPCRVKIRNDVGLLGNWTNPSSLFKKDKWWKDDEDGEV